MRASQRMYGGTYRTGMTKRTQRGYYLSNALATSCSAAA